MPMRLPAATRPSRSLARPRSAPQVSCATCRWAATLSSRPIPTPTPAPSSSSCASPAITCSPPATLSSKSLLREMAMYLMGKESRIRQKEAQRARENRAEIVKARSLGQVTRRDLIRWGIFTGAGTLAFKNGLSPFARSAFAAVPTGTPRSPLFGAAKFSQRTPRLQLQTPVPLTMAANGDAVFPAGSGYPNAKRLSYHNDFSSYVGDPALNPFRNPVTNRGPMEGRPPGEFFAHQRWEEFFPKVGYVMSWTECAPTTRFHPSFPAQNPDAVWCYGAGNTNQGTLPPFLS